MKVNTSQKTQYQKMTRKMKHNSPYPTHCDFPAKRPRHKYQFALKPVLVPVVNPDMPHVCSLFLVGLIHLPARFRTLECSILHFFRFLVLIQQFCLCLYRSIAPSSSISITLCRWSSCGLSIQVCGQQSSALSGSCAKLVHHLLLWLTLFCSF